MNSTPPIRHNRSFTHNLILVHVHCIWKRYFWNLQGHAVIFFGAHGAPNSVETVLSDSVFPAVPAIPLPAFPLPGIRSRPQLVSGNGPSPEIVYVG